MVEINISIRYNAIDEVSVAFANQFNDDLQRCLMRFAYKANISHNNNDDSNQFKIIILSHSENQVGQSEPWYAQYVRETGTLVVILSSLENHIIDYLRLSTVYALWEKVFETGELIKIRRDIQSTQARYWEKITDISFDLIGKVAKKSTKDKSEAIYLSQGDVYLNVDRENLKRDLNDLGFTVLPDKPFSTNINESSNQINQYLQESELIINIIPPIYTPFFVNQHLSLAEHQCNVTAEFVKNNPNAKRIIWIPSAYEISDEENQVFVEKLQRDQDQILRTTVLKTSIEELKKYYRSVLASGLTEKSTISDSLDLYVVMDKNDNGSLKSIRNTLSGKVKTFEDNFSGITYNRHLTNLARAKNLLIHYATENERWLKVKINDILKAKGFESYRPFENIILYRVDNLQIANEHQSVFTHIIKDLAELSAIELNDN